MPEESGNFDADRLERIRSGLRIVALRATGDPEVAEEIVQEILARALPALLDGASEPPRHPEAYVRGIARHVIADRYRERERRRRLVDALAVLGIRRRPHPLDGLIREEERERLRAALARLAPGDREILRRCYFEGRTPAEVAEALGAPPARIRKRKSRALKRLRQLFLARDARHDHASRPTGEGGGDAGSSRGEG